MGVVVSCAVAVDIISLYARFPRQLVMWHGYHKNMFAIWMMMRVFIHIWGEEKRVLGVKALSTFHELCCSAALVSAG